MRTIRLGKTNLMVSELGFGGIPIQRLSEGEAVEVVTRCLDLGVTFVDTANGYTTSEERIGKAIKGRRDRLVLATKSGARDPKTLREHVDLSFRHLDVDYIDLIQFHNVSTEEHYEQVVAPGGLLEAAQEYKAAGRIGHIGVSSHHPDVAKKLVATDLFETLMFPFCVVTPEPADDLIPLCREHDVGFLSMKPMGGGMIENATLAFKFLRQFPHILPVVGIQAMWEIEQIVGVMEGPGLFSSAEKAEALRLQQELGPRYCRGCDYCQPCTEDIRISSVLRLRSFVRRMPAERVRGEWGQNLIAKAETCADCGDCEARCPYNLPIRDMIKEITAWYHEEMSLAAVG
jgi:predicted aldo/keto reductase-like oxidoreductase